MLDYQDYRYILQDTGTLFVGAKFSFGDIAKEEEVPFKFRSIVMRHLLNEVDTEDTFESVFYYMKPEGYLYEVFLQLRAKVKVSELTPVKGFFGQTKWVYKERICFLGMEYEKRWKRRPVSSRTGSFESYVGTRGDGLPVCMLETTNL